MADTPRDSGAAKRRGRPPSGAAMSPQERKSKSREALEASGGREIRIALPAESVADLERVKFAYCARTDAEAIRAALRWIAEQSR